MYEDEDLLVINKPAGRAVGAGNWMGTLVNALLHHCGNDLSGIGGVIRPGIVHRLDKDTSGLMLVAKNDMAHQAFLRSFRMKPEPHIPRACVGGSYAPGARMPHWSSCAESAKNGDYGPRARGEDVL